MKRKDFVTLEKVGRGLAKIPGMPELVEEERAAALLCMRLSLLNKLEKPCIFRKQR
jgi:hypothetical protein